MVTVILKSSSFYFQLLSTIMRIYVGCSNETRYYKEYFNTVLKSKLLMDFHHLVSRAPTSSKTLAAKLSP
uniref:Uncharacterized protein n=2 Tax=Arundo donax TaxID=35708 RepID=A0A0A9HU13_ARUDO